MSLTTLDKIAKTYDVIVLGSGVAGLSSAIFASLEGAKLLLVEKTRFIGGTSALSGGTVWAPGSDVGRQVNSEDSREAVSSFLDSVVGSHGDKAMRETFLDAAPGVIKTLTSKTSVAFRPYPKHPDYEWAHPFPTLNGRAIEPVPFDTRSMGKLREIIRPPIPEFTVLGGMNIDRFDIGHALNRFKSFGSFLYTAKLVLRYLRDKFVYGRHTRLVMGGALIGRLLSSTVELGVDILLDCSTEAITPDSDGTYRLTLNEAGNIKEKAVIVTGGVVFCTGGFGRNSSRRESLLPEQLGPHSPCADGNTGTAHDLAESLGAVYGSGNAQNAFWAPCSIRKRKDGSEAVYPHFVLDRSKPGTVCVDSEGSRFINESVSYHVFAKTMLEGGSRTAHAWIITDAHAIAKYGLGQVRPGGDSLKPYLADSYLIEGATLEELAEKTGMKSELLKASVDTMNNAADAGFDKQFERGTTPYQQHNGDAAVSPNPTLGHITTPPYYAVKLIPADIGTALGFFADSFAGLRRKDGSTIDGLYAAGNDMHSIMGGTYPGPGITLGPGLVFGAIAGRHAAARARKIVGNK